MKTNTIHNENCLDTMARMEDDFVDLTVTSPPYDNLRTYNGYSFDFENIAKELYRVTKEGGIVVWIVGDATVKGSETGTSFKQALFFKECGFKLHDTMIWNKPNSMPNVIKTRYRSSFEYMFVFTKGKPKTTNMIQEPCKYAGVSIKRTKGNIEAIGKDKSNLTTKSEKIKSNVWDFIVAGTNYGHPATFPEQLANDHIMSWSNEGDIVYDPFMGSGTTAKMAIVNNRRYVGSEMSKEYCEIAEERINKPDLFTLDTK
jgi:DNA modification methylase